MNPIESVVSAVMPCLIHRFVTNVSDVIGGLEDVRKNKIKYYVTNCHHISPRHFRMVIGCHDIYDMR